MTPFKRFPWGRDLRKAAKLLDAVERLQAVVAAGQRALRTISFVDDFSSITQIWAVIGDFVLKHLLALAAVLTLGAGTARAVDYIVNVSAPTPTYFTQFNQPGAVGAVTFPEVNLYAGDTLEVYVDFGFSLASKGLTETCEFGFCRSYDIYGTFDASYHQGKYGYVNYSLPYDSVSTCGNPDILCIPTYVYETNYRGGPDNSFYSFSGVSYLFSPVPEASTWLILIIGGSGVGLALRRRRQVSLASAR
jgi:hypothetical protein